MQKLQGTVDIATERTSTILGFCSILFWSSTVAISRSLAESLGRFTTAALVYLIGGVLSCAIVAIRPNGLRHMLALPRRYMLICGSLFMLYAVALYVAIGFAHDRRTTLLVGLVNYLWPALVFVFSIPILGKRARWYLAPGIALAILGVILAATSGQPFTLNELLAILGGNAFPIAAALVAAISWGLYTNFSRRLHTGEGSAVPLFILSTGIILLALRLTAREESHWSPSVGLMLAAIVIFPVLLSAIFWERAVRKGNLLIVAAASYLTPVLSTLISSVVLDVTLDARIWIGCALVSIGAVVCNVAFLERNQRHSV